MDEDSTGKPKARVQSFTESNFTEVLVEILVHRTNLLLPFDSGFFSNNNLINLPSMTQSIKRLFICPQGKGKDTLQYLCMFILFYVF